MKEGSAAEHLGVSAAVEKVLKAGAFVGELKEVAVSKRLELEPAADVLANEVDEVLKQIEATPDAA